MTQADQAYSTLVTMLEGLRDFHPELLQAVSASDQEVLSRYYFFGRDIDTDNIFIYRDALLEKFPHLEGEAQAALRRFLAANGITGDPAKPMDWISRP